MIFENYSAMKNKEQTKTVIRESNENSRKIKKIKRRNVVRNTNIRISNMTHRNTRSCGRFRKHYTHNQILITAKSVQQ